MLETSVTHCKTNKNIDEIGKVTILGNVAQKIKNVASTETIDDKNLNDSVSINNHINTDNSTRSNEGSNHAERFTILHTSIENNNNNTKVKKKLEYLNTNTGLREIKTNEVSNIYHNPRKKPTIVNDTTFQMTSNDERYHSPVISTQSNRTTIRNGDSNGSVKNLSKDFNNITGERINSIGSNKKVFDDVIKNKLHRTIHHGIEMKQIIEKKDINVSVNKVDEEYNNTSSSDE